MHRTDGALLPNQANTTTACVMATVHNWVEHVYKVFGQTLPTDPNKVALVGVREARLSLAPVKKGVGAPARLESAEDAAAQGTDVIETDTRQADKPKSTTTFNDLLYMVWTDTDAHHEQRVEVYKCTIDPGADLSSTTGTPMLLEGKLYKCLPGIHNSYKDDTGNAIVALHIYTGPEGTLEVVREASKSTLIMDKLECALVRANPGATVGTWEFCAHEMSDPGIHIHFSHDETTVDATVGSWSVGCTVLRHGINSPRFKAFMHTARGAANSQEIPYIVVSSEYIRTYTEWHSAIADGSVKPSDPAGVLKRDKLVAREDAPQTYIPSIATKDFVKAVVKFAHDVGAAGNNPKALFPLRGYLTHAPATEAGRAKSTANLIKSLNAMCFTVSV